MKFAPLLDESKLIRYQIICYRSSIFNVTIIWNRMMSQRNGIMIPILLFMLLSNGKPSLSNPPDVTSSNSKDLTRYTCINQADKKKDQPIKPVWIHSSNDAQNNIGILDTPNFPNRFPLPLRCMWIFDNTGYTNNAKNNLFIYFTRVR